MVFVYHAFSISAFEYLIPVFLIIAPYVTQNRLKFNFRGRDILLGIIVSLITLLPLIYFMLQSNKEFSLLPAGVIFFQFFGISLPEEIYFRGFLQESMGNNIKNVLLVSLLFSLMHVPQAVFYGDIYPLLTFFPSLIMGFLYMRTSNVLPSVIFHFLANIVWLGMR